MATTPDEYPGQRVEESILLEDNPDYPTTPGQMRFKDGGFRFYDDTGLFDPRAGSAQVGFAIFTISGGLVYDTDGHPVLKVES